MFWRNEEYHYYSKEEKSESNRISIMIGSNLRRMELKNIDTTFMMIRLKGIEKSIIQTYIDKHPEELVMTTIVPNEKKKKY